LIILVILYLLLGWLLAIAINHAADILPTRTTLGRLPACMTCKTPYPIGQWSALLAWLSGKTVCESCQTTRSRLIRSVIVELVTPLLFLFLWFRYGFSIELGLISLYTVILLLITVTDLEHRLIFHIVILPSIILAAAAGFITPSMTWRQAMVGGALAFIVVYIAALVSRGGLGEGDVTLSTFLGFILGFPHIILSLLFGVFFGGLVAFLLLISGRVTLKTFIPYGPFLTITGWIMLVWGAEIWAYYFS
jgi:prepilin signal peptidase PulO-like enzyme (type II secretory pathway)